MITLIIKGERSAASAAAKLRGVPLHHLTETRDPWTVAETYDAFQERVVKWYCEPPLEAPFPTGALLLYTQNDRKEPLT